MKRMTLADGKLIDPAGGKRIRDIAVRNILFAPPIVTIGNRKIGDWAREDGSVKDGRGVVNQFRARVGNQEPEPAGKALLEFGLESMIVRVANIVAEQGHGSKSRKGFHELRSGNRLAANRGRSWNLPKIRIGHFDEKRGSLRQVRYRQLIQVGIRNSDMRALGTGVSDFEVEIAI